MFASSVIRDEVRNPIWQEAGRALRIPVSTVSIRNADSRALAFKGGWDEWRADPDGYRWGGPSLDWNPGSGILPFRIHVATPGRYRLALRSRKGAGGCFVCIDRGQWWITLGAAANDWSWQTARESGPSARSLWEAELEGGFHLIEISGRATGFEISDLALVMAGDAKESDPDAIAAASRRPR